MIGISDPMVEAVTVPYRILEFTIVAGVAALFSVAFIIPFADAWSLKYVYDEPRHFVRAANSIDLPTSYTYDKTFDKTEIFGTPVMW